MSLTGEYHVKSISHEKNPLNLQNVPIRKVHSVLTEAGYTHIKYHKSNGGVTVPLGNSGQQLIYDTIEASDKKKAEKAKTAGGKKPKTTKVKAHTRKSTRKLVKGHKRAKPALRKAPRKSARKAAKRKAKR